MDLEERRQRRTPFRFSFYFTRRVKRDASNRVVSSRLNFVRAMPACRYRSGNIWQPLFVLGVSLILAVRRFRQVSQYAVNIFFSDQWAIHEATLFQKHTLWEMFRWRYDAHRLGVGGLLAYFLEPHFHWNSRGGAFLATSIVTLAALCAIYLKTRLWGRIRLFDLAIPIIFLTPAQYESLSGDARLRPRTAASIAGGALLHGSYLRTGGGEIHARLDHEFPGDLHGLRPSYGHHYAGLADAGIFLRDARPSGLRAWCCCRFTLSVVSLASFLVGYVPESFVDCASPAPRSPVTYSRLWGCSRITLAPGDLRFCPYRWGPWR